MSTSLFKNGGMFRHGVFAGPPVPMRDLIAAGYPEVADMERLNILARIKNCAYLPFPLVELATKMHEERLWQLNHETERFSR